MAAKTRKQLEADTGALLKMVFSELERLASMPPEQAAHPYTLEPIRARLMRRIWSLFKASINYDPRGEV